MDDIYLDLPPVENASQVVPNNGMSTITVSLVIDYTLYDAEIEENFSQVVRSQLRVLIELQTLLGAALTHLVFPDRQWTYWAL
jgi:hypothetical protein